MLIAFISGCLNYEQITTIKTDGSGEMYIHYWMEVKSGKDSLLIDRFGFFNPDSIQNQFDNEFNSITKVTFFFDDDDSTAHAQIEFSFNNIDSLSKAGIFKNANFSFVDAGDGLKVFSQFIPPIPAGFGFSHNNIKVNYIYYLPGDIISHNGHEIKRNKITWNFELSEIMMGKTITATIRPFKLKETPQWIYYLAIIVLVVVIFFLLKKNRS